MHQRIPSYNYSVISKLHNSRVRLESVLAIVEWVITTSSATNATSGGTLSTTMFSTPSPDISGNIDDFFGNIFSALDIFAQVINLVYLVPPLSERNVKFYKVVVEMKQRLPNEGLTTYFLPLPKDQWYKNMRAFRHCATHRKSIPFRTLMEYESMQTSAFPAVKAILLPDNPYRIQPTFHKKRMMKGFGVSLLQNTLTAIDDMYNIMETRVRRAKHIPV